MSEVDVQTDRGRSIRHSSPRLVTVVIPAYNAAETLADQLAALERQTYPEPWELVIADNGSLDATVSVVEQSSSRFPSLVVVDASEGTGAGYARNAGVQLAEGDLLAFCDADDVVHDDWLSELVDAALSADVVGGAISETHDSLPRIMGFLPHAPSGCMAVWRSVFDQVGGFDQRFKRAEDPDFSWRAQLLGFTVRFAPAARIWRRTRSDLKGVATQSFGYGYWAALLYREYRDHGMPRTSILQLIRRIVWLGLRLPYLLISERRRRIWIRSAAYGVGALLGSWSHRVLYTP